MAEMISVVTGANRGLGRSMATHLAAAGHGVIGTYHADGQKAESDAMVAEIEAAGGKNAMLLLDVGKTANLVPFRDRLALVSAIGLRPRRLRLPRQQCEDRHHAGLRRHD